MKRSSLILFLLCITLAVSAQQTDSSRFAALGLKLAEYYDAMKYESLDVQKSECDFLIESATDSDLRQFIAQDIYDHYIDSPVMGSENVAVYVYDKWFAEGKLNMRSQEELLDAKVHADFNRQSLIGCQAPYLNMESIDGTRVCLFDAGNRPGVFRVLYFYDTDCAKCKMETMFLNALFASKDYPVEFYAIYVGDKRQEWEHYVAEQFTSVPDAFHLWDPSLDSDFQNKYGVVRTPRLLLIDPEGVIIGRGLDTQALDLLLETAFASRQLEYGSRESEELFDGIFAASSGRPSENEVKGIADYIHDKTLAMGDVLMFKQLAGDYLYYLSTRTSEGFREGMRYHIDKNILSQDKVWTSQDDSLRVVGFAQMMSDLLSKSAPGSVITSIRVPAQRYTWRGSKSVDIRLDRLHGKRNIIIFYTEGCDVCAAEKEHAVKLLEMAADRKLSGPERRTARQTEVYMVNVDQLMSSDPQKASNLMDHFDLSSLPYITMTDSHGIVLRRYFSLQ